MPSSPTHAEVGAGPPVLLIHGQPGLGSDWDGVVAALRADHRLLAPDRPGYGDGGPDPTTMAGNAAALADLLESRSAAPAVVVGHSYGGGIAILLAARRPDLVRGLVLVGSVGRAGSVNAFDRAMAAPVLGEVLSATGLFALGKVLPRLRRRAARLGPQTAWLVESLPDERYLHLAPGPGRQIWRSFVAEQRALVAEIADVEAAVAAVRAPAVVVTGTLDVVVPPTVAVALAAALPSAELVTVARAGHFVPRDHPGVVAAAVRRVEARGQVPPATPGGHR